MQDACRGASFDVHDDSRSLNCTMVRKRWQVAEKPGKIRPGIRGLGSQAKKLPVRTQALALLAGMFGFATCAARDDYPGHCNFDSEEESCGSGAIVTGL
jgi:hypothetical protein